MSRRTRRGQRGGVRCLYLSLSRAIASNRIGGAGTHIRETIAALDRRGVEVVTSIGGDHPRAGPSAGRSPRARLFELAPPLVRDVGMLVRDLGPVRGIPEVDVVYERWAYLQLRGRRLARRLRVPHVLEVNGPPGEISDFFGSPLHRTAGRRLARMLRATDAVVAVSGPLLGLMVSMGADPGRAFAVHNGAPARLLVDGEKMERPTDGDLVVAYAGSFKPWHRVELLVEAFARSLRVEPDLRLILVGEGMTLENVRHMAGRLGIGDRVEWTGGLEPEAVGRALARADIGVIPHCEWYMSPVKLFEYGAAGNAVVAPNVGSVAEVLADGESALLFEPESADGMTDAIVRLAREPGLRRRMAGTWHEAVRDRHTWDHVAHRIIGIMDRAAASART